MNGHRRTLIARQMVEARMGFFIHAAVYVLVMAVLFAVNALAGGPWWVQWPLIGWGAGVAAHGAAIFGLQSQWVRHWQLRKIHELRAKL